MLRAAKACGVYTKSSIMLGLGETDDEIIDTLVDLRDCGVDIVTFGQYLQPTPRHLEVQEFVPPEKFEHWRRYGEQELGFRCAHVAVSRREHAGWHRVEAVCAWLCAHTMPACSCSLALAGFMCWLA